MCYAKPGPRCSAHARAELNAALKANDSQRLAKAKNDYLLTPAGIAEMEVSDPELAELLREERGLLIQQVDMNHGSKIVMPKRKYP